MAQPVPSANTPDPDAGLLARLRAGEAGADQEMFDRFFPMALRLARARFGNDAEAEDAALEALEEAFQGLPSFQGKSKLSTWVYRVLRNRICRNARNRQRVELAGLDEEIADPAPGPRERFESHREFIRLLKDIQHLTPEQAWAVTLCRVIGLELDEGAEVLGLSVPALKMRIQRGLETLRRKRKARE
ncbi:MAG: RNA polymerase sigma factor [candidate division WOR-3 bacterium]